MHFSLSLLRAPPKHSLFLSVDVAAVGAVSASLALALGPRLSPIENSPKQCAS